MMRTIDRRSNWRRTNGRRPRALGRWLLTLVVGLGASGLGETLWAQDRGFGIEGPTTSAPDPVKIEGNYWAVLIGIDKYEHADDLKGAVKDVKAIESVLTDRYGFAPERVTRLLNEQAKREPIINTLYAMSKKAGPNDSVFIYYAGHGQSDGPTGWWVPADGTPGAAGSLIKNVEIRDYIKDMRARHVYVVADSCFSGSLFSKRRLPPINARYYATLYAQRSRWGLSSGANEPVADQGLEGHSPFAWFFLKALRENGEPYLVPSEIHTAVAREVGAFAGQTPLSEPLDNSRHEGGQFVFRLTDVTVSPTPVTRPTSVSVPSVTNPAPGGPKKKPEREWKGMLDLLEKLPKEKTS